MNDDDVPVILLVRQQRQEIERLQDALREIGDYAHDRSTGPAVPDALWEVRAMAYDAIPTHNKDYADRARSAG